MKDTERSKEIPKFPSLGRGAPVHSEKQMFGRNDDGFHFRNIDFEVMAKTSGGSIQKTVEMRICSLKKKKNNSQITGLYSPAHC